MSCNKKLLTLFFCISFNLSLFAQNNGEQILDSFAGKFISVIRTHEKQRAYLVTDKAFYCSGESIWMKAFILNRKISTLRYYPGFGKTKLISNVYFKM